MKWKTVILSLFILGGSLAFICSGGSNQQIKQLAESLKVLADKKLIQPPQPNKPHTPPITIKVNGKKTVGDIVEGTPEYEMIKQISKIPGLKHVIEPDIITSEYKITEEQKKAAEKNIEKNKIEEKNYFEKFKTKFEETKQELNQTDLEAFETLQNSQEIAKWPAALSTLSIKTEGKFEKKIDKLIKEMKNSIMNEKEVPFVGYENLYKLLKTFVY